MVSRTPRSACSTRSRCLRYSPWPRRQYVDGGAPLQATPRRSTHAAPRLCAPLPAALPEPQSSQILRAACAQPAAQSPGDARTCVSSYGASWAGSYKPLRGSGPQLALGSARRPSSLPSSKTAARAAKATLSAWSSNSVTTQPLRTAMTSEIMPRPAAYLTLNEMASPTFS